MHLQVHGLDGSSIQPLNLELVTSNTVGLNLVRVGHMFNCGQNYGYFLV